MDWAHRSRASGSQKLSHTWAVGSALGLSFTLLLVVRHGFPQNGNIWFWLYMYQVSSLGTGQYCAFQLVTTLCWIRVRVACSARAPGFSAAVFLRHAYTLSGLNFWVNNATEKVRHLKFAHNFGSDALSFMKHHVCLCNDNTSQLDLVLDQLGLIHCPPAINTPSSAATEKVRQVRTIIRSCWEHLLWEVRNQAISCIFATFFPHHEGDQG